VTAREQFAGWALQGLLAHCGGVLPDPPAPPEAAEEAEKDAAALAAAAVRYADALVQALAGPVGPVPRADRPPGDPEAMPRVNGLNPTP
jgi:hypothetical protein